MIFKLFKSEEKKSILQDKPQSNSQIKVLGSGCKNCHTLHQNVLEAVKEMNLSLQVEYVADLQQIMEAGVMSMPALMLNGELVSSGKVLKVEEIKGILSK